MFHAPQTSVVVITRLPVERYAFLTFLLKEIGHKGS